MQTKFSKITEIGQLCFLSQTPVKWGQAASERQNIPSPPYILSRQNKMSQSFISLSYLIIICCHQPASSGLPADQKLELWSCTFRSNPSLQFSWSASLMLLSCWTNSHNSKSKLLFVGGDQNSLKEACSKRTNNCY